MKMRYISHEIYNKNHFGVHVGIITAPSPMQASRQRGYVELCHNKGYVQENSCNTGFGDEQKINANFVAN